MTTKSDILAAIRRKCLDCCCQQPGEVRLCHITACDLWPFRFGTDPSPSQTRGFAKPSLYTGDLADNRAGGHSGSTHQGSFGKSPVHTEGFERQSHPCPPTPLRRA